MNQRDAVRMLWLVAGLVCFCAEGLQAATITVTSREDSGAGTFRQALADATAGDAIDFAVPGGNSITVYSRLTVDKQLTIDGGGSQVVGANGGNYEVLYLDYHAVGTVIRDLAVIDGDVGIFLQNCANCQILGCRLGTNWANATGVGNNRGLQISNTWGGTVGAPAQGNVISGNNSYGFYISASGNLTIQGNFIGPNSSGTGALPGQDYGIYMLYGSSITVGGNRWAGEGNLVSGNTQWGMVIGTATGSTSNITVTGNLVGCNANQSSGLPNTNGIRVGQNATGVQVGQPLDGYHNVIFGNSGQGVGLDSCSGNTVQNNLIGLNEGGWALGNNVGVEVLNASGNVVGGRLNPVYRERNVISGQSATYGVWVTGTSSGNTVSGNFIGTDVTGNSPVANHYGVYLYNCSNNLVGGASADSLTARGNLISGNSTYGVYANLGSANGIQGNLIGLNLTATAALPNGDGIALENCTGFTVGSPVYGTGNVISGNGNGLILRNGTRHVVSGNRFGTNPSGLVQFPNSLASILLDNGDDCWLGGTAAGAGNHIAGNRLWFANDADGNSVAGNLIGLMADGSTPAVPIDYTLYVNNGSQHNWFGLPSGGGGNLIAHALIGVYLTDSTDYSNGFFGNTILACSDPVWLNGGANNGKLPPVISVAYPAFVSGTAGAYDYIEVFKAENGTGQGGSYGLAGFATANSTGNWIVVTAGLQAGDYVTAMATDPQNNTSDFCDNQTVLVAPTPTVTPTSTQTPVVTPTPQATATPTATPTAALSGVDTGGKLVLPYPNPASDRMRFVLHLDRAAAIKLDIFNLAGERVATLQEHLPAGRGQVMVWDCRDVAPGIYLVRVSRDGELVETRRVAVVK